MAAPRAPFLRFHDQFERHTSGCWNWTGYLGNNGYGKLKVFGELVSAHRFAHTLYNGPIPDGMCVLHSCDNKRCVNPEHLRVGTHQENLREAAERGRMPKGERHPMWGRRNPRPKQAHPVRVLGTEYESQKAAERALGLGSGTVRYWLLKHPQKATLIMKGTPSC